MDDTIFLILISLLFSAFFSGVEIAFVSSSKVRLELDKKTSNIIGSILGMFFRNQEQFISTMLVGNNIALVIYGIGMARILEPVLRFLYANELFVLIGQTIISTLIILFTAEFLPKTLFRISPNFLLRFFAFPLFIIYIILYPVSKISSLLSKGILYILGVKMDDTEESQEVSKVDLDFFIRQKLDKVPDNSDVETEVKMFQNALDFSNVKVRDCMVPRAEIVAMDIETVDKQEIK